MVTTTLTDLRTGSVNAGLAAARDMSREAVDRWRSEAVADPWFFLSRVGPQERDRVCTAVASDDPLYGSQVSAGEPWPQACGASWGYTTLEARDVAVEVTPPGPAGGELVVSAVARSGGVLGGWQARLLRRPTGEWTAASEESMDLSQADTAGVELVGASVYSGGNLDRSTVALRDSTLVAEGTLAGSGTLVDTLTYSAQGRPDGLATLGDVARYAELSPASQAQLTDELDLRVRVRLASAASVGIARRWGGVGQQAWSLYTDASGRAVFVTNTGLTATSAAPLAGQSTVWLRARFSSRDAQGRGAVTLYQAPGTVSEPTAWTPVGSATGASAKLAGAAQAPVQLGVATSGGTAVSSGASRVLRFSLRAAPDSPEVAGVRLDDPGLAMDATALADAGGGQWVLVGAQLSPSASASVGTARDVTIAPLKVSGVGSGMEAVSSLVCPSRTPANVVAGGLWRVDHLCLRRGAQVRDVSGALATVPPDTVAYRLEVSGRDGANPDAAARGAKVTVWVSSKQSGAPTTGDLVGASGVAVAAGTHPGAASYWTQLAVSWLPVSGVVVTDTDVHVGLCGPAFTAGGACGTMTPGESLTVVAGSSAAPADVWVSGPVSDADATVAAWASGYVVFPYWARPSGGGTEVDMSLVAAGLGMSPSGAGATAPFQGYPQPTDRGANAVSGRLSLRSVVGRVVDLQALGTWADVALVPGGRPTEVPAPYAPAFEQRWETVSARAVPGQVLCGSDTCSQWLD